MRRRKYRNIGLHKKYNTKLIIGVIIFVLGIALIQLGIEFREHIIPIYSYEAKKDSQYIVRLKPNDFYEQETLPEDKYYASKSIDNFNVNFKYDFKANKQAKLDYSYRVTAELVGNIDTTDNKDKEVWNRNFNILDNNREGSSSDKFSINQNIDINYENYNNLVNSYEKVYGIKIDATLKVKLNVYVDVKIADFETQKIEDNIEIDIPITNTVTEVKKNYKNTIGQINPEIGKIQIRELVMYIVGGIFITISFIILVIEIRKLRKELSLSQEKFADKYSIGQTTISNNRCRKCRRFSRYCRTN